MKSSSHIPLYEPIRKKGAGAFGYVIEAYDPKRDCKIAVKRVRKAEKKISREYQILKELNGNTHCIELLDIFYTTSQHDNKEHLSQYFLLEYMPDNLENYITSHKSANKQISMPVVKSIMKQLFKGLQAMHFKNICHRDLKPENVLLDENLNVKICDFGSAKKMVAKDEKNMPKIVSRYYRAPELICGRSDYGCAIDMWAAGCILLELLTLEPLFPGKNDGSQIFEILSILGSPSEEDRKWLFEKLPDETVSMLESVLPDFRKTVDFKAIIPIEHYKRTDIAQASDLAKKLLAWNEKKRLAADKAVDHEFCI